MSLMDEPEGEAEEVCISVLIGTLDFSHWCDKCFLPSAVRTPILAGVDGNEQHVISVDICPECGSVFNGD